MHMGQHQCTYPFWQTRYMGTPSRQTGSSPVYPEHGALSVEGVLPTPTFGPMTPINRPSASTTDRSFAMAETQITECKGGETRALGGDLRPSQHGRPIGVPSWRAVLCRLYIARWLEIAVQIGYIHLWRCGDTGGKCYASGGPTARRWWLRRRLQH